MKGAPTVTTDPLWYKDAIIYEVHVRAFMDSDGDGIGDFRGLTSKLDHLEDLGITAIWLLPFYPSPLRDDGYDIADYSDVNPNYGNLRDFKLFVREAHRRGMKVFTELVCNHTSDQHPWFQRARLARPGSNHRNFYVWSDSPDKYAGVRIIFKDFEPSNWSWDPVAKSYYWHRFFHHQPDLNFDNPAVVKAILDVFDEWMEMGVDGFRLDAVPYLFEREGTSCENLPETHAVLRLMREHLERHYPGRVLLAEANQWPEDAVTYFGDGDECHMSFHFPIMPRLFMALRMEDRFPIVDILDQTPNIPETAQWALFLRNHDELTLEMVTDEERDYMYRAYTQDHEARINLGIRHRLAPLLRNDRRRIELMNALLFSLPGTPVVYYGDEIGMGDNIYLGDRNGVRTPMQWSPDRNAGFSQANPQRLYLPVITDPEYHYQAINVEAQRSNPSSLLNWTRRLIALRKRHPAFGRGTMELVQPDNRKVLAYLRRHGHEVILVVANLSRFVQAAELDLVEFAGHRPVEMFGDTEFPIITDAPWFVTLSPHGFMWFTLRSPATGAGGAGAPALAVVGVAGPWTSLLDADGSGALASALPTYLQSRRWFAGKARRIGAVRVLDAIPMNVPGRQVRLVTLEVEYRDAESEVYVLPMAHAADSDPRIHDLEPYGVLRIEGPERGLVYDAAADPEFSSMLLDAFDRHRTFRGRAGQVSTTQTSRYRALRGDGMLTPQVSSAEQSNTSIRYGDRLMLKLFRRLGDGMNPDWEIGRHLTERTDASSVARVAGAIEYRRRHHEPATVAVLYELLPTEGDAWEYTLADVAALLGRQRARDTDAPAGSAQGLLDASLRPLPAAASRLLGPYAEVAAGLGRATADLHLALARAEEPAFRPEPSSGLQRRSVYQSVRAAAARTMATLRRRQGDPVAQSLARTEPQLERRIKALLDSEVGGLRMRIHGDLHLGQALRTPHGWVLVDFEGEPDRPLHDRRLKRSPLRDVAGMLRSFAYAAETVLQRRGESGDDGARRVATTWQRWAAVAYVAAYLERVGKADFLPPTPEGKALVLDVMLIEKALYEIEYELQNRPEWVEVPMRGLLELLNA